MPEYLVLCTIVLALVAVPIEGSDSAVALMLDAVQTAWLKFLAAMSLPQ
jgi:hypothetical protein